MKKFFLLLVHCSIALLITAQVPESITYMAVARDITGNLLTNRLVSFRLTIVRGTPSGTEVFSEIHQETTNSFGMVSMEIGAGNLLSGDFASIQWGNDSYYLRTELDPAGGDAFQPMGTTRFLSVPYALYAKSAGVIGGLSLLQDSDRDTRIMLEKTTDEDTVRVSTAGTEYFTLAKGRINVLNSGHSVFLGNGAGKNDNLEENKNVFLGDRAGFMNSTGQKNTAAGSEALQNNSSGYENSALGSGALGTNSTGVRNTAVGAEALGKNTTGYGNTAIGFQSMFNNPTGSSNAAFGWHSLFSNVNGSDNMAIGPYALYNNTYGYSNAGIGTQALFHNRTGIQNVAVGYTALYYNYSGSGNIAIGTGALMNNTSIGSLTAIGDSAMMNNGSGATGTQGRQNSAIGSKALFSNTTGYSNTAVGFRALSGNNGDFNTAVGNMGLNKNTTGIGNSSCGDEALSANTIGSVNSAVGYLSMNANIDGSQNTGIGVKALFSNTNGNGNTACGSFALQNNTTGYGNTGLGYAASISAANMICATAVGGDAWALNNYSVFVGSAAVNSIGGFVGWSNFSDGRFKEEVQENVPGLAFISKLRPVTYHWNSEQLSRHTRKNSADSLINQFITRNEMALKKQDAIAYSGFVAQEVEQTARECGYSFSGVHAPENETDVYSLRYGEFVPAIVKSIQEQQVMISAQQKIIDAQQAEIEALKKQVAAILDRIH